MSTGLYPVFLKLDGMRAVVVGGGRVAASKLDGLRRAGAHIAVIAPEIIDDIRLVASTEPRIELIQKPFAPSDLDGARWVIAAAPAGVNRDVGRAAAERQLFVNAVDDPASATAYLGGVVRRGPVELAISTSGTAPALAGLLREALDAVLPEDLERWHEIALAERARWKTAGVPMERRRPLLLEALIRLYAEREP